MPVSALELDARQRRGALHQAQGARAWQNGQLWRARWLFYRATRADRELAGCIAQFCATYAFDTALHHRVVPSLREAVVNLNRMLPALATPALYSELAGHHARLARLHCDPARAARHLGLASRCRQQAQNLPPCPA